MAEIMETGGQVMAIVPQTFSEIQRVAFTIINAGLAPASLVKFAKAEDSEAEVEAIGKRNVAAVSACIMAGAELGLPPMVSLRAFTVINGKPALYADGNVAVVRKAKTPDGKRVAEYIKTGYTEVCDFICPVCKGTLAGLDEAKIHLIIDHGKEYDRLAAARVELSFARTPPTEQSFAWCEGKRADSGEVYRETFSIEDARRAGLWEGDKPFKRAKVWRNQVLGWHDDVPNDSPWFRYWKRMMMWRAVGYCLRWLFADVLGGMADEYEAREIDGMIDVSPAQPPRQVERPQPPTPPEPDAPTPPVTKQPIPDGQENNTAADQAGDFNNDDSGDAAEFEAPYPPSAASAGHVDNTDDEFLANLSHWLNHADTEEEIEQTWADMDVEATFDGNDEGRAKAEAMRAAAIEKLQAKP